MPEFHSVSPRYPSYLRTMQWLETLLIIIFASVVTYFWEQVPNYAYVLVVVGIISISLIVHFWWVPKKYALTSYCVNDDQVQLKKGALWRTHQAVAVNRIQHSEVAQGPFERWFKLSRLIIYTAGGAGADLSIAGLPTPVAEQLKARLLRQIVAEAPIDETPADTESTLPRNEDA